MFVANDSMPNFLFRNARAGWRFEEVALRAGVAVASDGKARAGMGTDAGDYDGDGRLDLVVTNLDLETHSLFADWAAGCSRTRRPRAASDRRRCRSSASASSFFDFDNDTQLDLAIANGHIIDNAPLFRAGATHAQRKLLFRNVGVAAVRRSRPHAPGRASRWRRSAAAWRRATSTTTAISICSSPTTARPRTCSATTAATANALLVRLIGKQSNRDGIGARLRLTTGPRTQMREVKAGSSYLGQNDLRLHFGLGAATLAERLEVRWPSGRDEVL